MKIFKCFLSLALIISLSVSSIVTSYGNVLPAPTQGENLAIGKVLNNPTYRGAYRGAGYDVDMMVDGSMETYFSSTRNPSEANRWVFIDLGINETNKNKKVGKIVLKHNNLNSPQVIQGTSWNKYTEIPNSKLETVSGPDYDTTIITFPEITTRYIRLNFGPPLSAPGTPWDEHMVLYEFEVYECFPTIELLGETDITLEKGALYTEPGYVAVDTNGADITSSVVVGGDTVNSEQLGTYFITYNVTDGNGKQAEQAVRKVTVISDGESLPPVAYNVEITGYRNSVRPGDVLLGNYYYFDGNGDAESGTTVRWLGYAQENLSDAPEVLGTDISYTVSAADLSKYIVFEVTPRNEAADDAEGEPAKSAPRKVRAAAYAIHDDFEDLTAGDVGIGETIRGWQTDGDALNSIFVEDEGSNKYIRMNFGGNTSYSIIRNISPAITTALEGNGLATLDFRFKTLPESGVGSPHLLLYDGNNILFDLGIGATNFWFDRVYGDADSYTHATLPPGTLTPDTWYAMRMYINLEQKYVSVMYGDNFDSLKPFSNSQGLQDFPFYAYGSPGNYRITDGEKITSVVFYAWNSTSNSPKRYWTGIDDVSLYYANPSSPAAESFDITEDAGVINATYIFVDPDHDMELGSFYRVLGSLTEDFSNSVVLKQGHTTSGEGIIYTRTFDEQEYYIKAELYPTADSQNTLVCYESEVLSPSAALVFDKESFTNGDSVRVSFVGDTSAAVVAVLLDDDGMVRYAYISNSNEDFVELKNIQGASTNWEIKAFALSDLGSIRPLAKVKSIKFQ